MINRLTKDVVLRHNGFDKLKYNLSYYRAHMAEKKAYNKEYYKNNKDKWNLKGSNSSSQSAKDILRNKFSSEADKLGYTGPAKEAYIKKKMSKYGNVTSYDEPIGPSAKKKKAYEYVTDPIVMPWVHTINQVKMLKQKSASKSGFTEEDMNYAINKIKEADLTIKEVEKKINATKDKIYTFLRQFVDI